MQPTIRQIIYHNYTPRQRVKFLYRFFKWQTIDKVFKRNLVYNFTPKSKLILMKGFQALSGNYYFGLAEPDVMPFVLHVLQPGDLFVDVGANGGTYTILASGEKGANTLAIEASPATFEGLTKNINLNNLTDLVEAWNVAASNENGYLPFTSNDHATNRVSFENRPDIIKVPAKTIDSLLNGRVPLLMKLDIEGHEHNALLGAINSISDSRCRALVVEFANTGEYYGYGNNATHKLLTDLGFKPNKYDYINKRLIPFDPLATNFDFNMIYIKDLDFIEQRLAQAEHILISGELI